MAPRRTHHKSKQGCTECKRRHIKCDETRPICVKCTASKRVCRWETNIKPSTATPIESTGDQRTPTALQPPGGSAPLTPIASDTTHSGCHTGSHATVGSAHPVLSQRRADSVVNIDHLELLYHFYTNTCRTLVRTQEQVELYRDLVVTRGIAHPFLMQQTLAFSALHIGILRPQQQEYYRSLATSLQSNGLADFNDILSQVDANTCVPVLLFSHLVALHTFHDLFTVLKDDFNTFMDGLVGCVRLLRGVNLVRETWADVLFQSELGGIMREADEMRHNNKASKSECSALRDLIEGADLSLTSREACMEALDKLQEFFNLENVYPGGSFGTTSVIFAWFVTASSQYTELVDQRRPEALVLLAYYAVLLHRRRRSWVVGDAGKRLFESVAAHLGRRWETWLTWPRSAIMSGTSSNTPSSAT
ncbi:hypothetical protein PV10_04203 [Exophiala mesophila]|uniref:Zn(2)-C6 fungal-type domain-containing protein n=1 Tax=Exophiala mesophila TaxID=212818 RepID=A0A0D1ZE19_EXOME|nr:uncharacterized protein PV10_04203 [Exophiala mesophila]KIV92952.1 hypothetical protein PV10_04203 [Exophiala mesophila]